VAGVSYGSLESGYRELCNRCFNEESHAAMASTFSMSNSSRSRCSMRPGQRPQISFPRASARRSVALDAFELRDEEPRGYHFQIIGDPQGDLFALMGQLVERMRAALALRHLEYDKQFGRTIADFLRAAGITWDDEQAAAYHCSWIDGMRSPGNNSGAC